MIAATVLAAGDSVRMGSPKALLDFRGSTFLETIRRKLNDVGIDIIYVVVGRDRAKILEDNELANCRVTENEELDRGPIGSVRSVLRVVSDDIEEMLIWPVDMPHVQTETIRSVIRAKSDRPIVVPTWRGHRGHPVLFKREIFQEILQLLPSATARDVVRADSERVHGVEVADPAVVDSINTVEDYRRLAR